MEFSATVLRRHGFVVLFELRCLFLQLHLLWRKSDLLSLGAGFSSLTKVVLLALEQRLFPHLQFSASRGISELVFVPLKNKLLNLSVSIIIQHVDEYIN